MLLQWHMTYATTHATCDSFYELKSGVNPVWGDWSYVRMSWLCQIALFLFKTFILNFCTCGPVRNSSQLATSPQTAFWLQGIRLHLYGWNQEPVRLVGQAIEENWSVLWSKYLKWKSFLFLGPWRLKGTLWDLGERSSVTGQRVRS